MLYISDYKKIRISRVSTSDGDVYAIHFWYDGRHYLLQSTLESFTCIMLYRFEEDNTLSSIGSCYADIQQFLDYKGSRIVYKNINMINFVFMLDYYELAKTEFHYSVQKYSKKMKEREHSIRQMKTILSSL